jgi:hypothetical protein
MAIVTPNRLSTEEQEALSRLISLHQTDGLSESAPIDKDFLIQDGNFDLFFLNYFPNDFLAFERLNYELLNFLESESQGMAWLPGGHGKTTTIVHWMPYVLCREPQVSFIYCEKSEPAAHARARAIMDILEFNKKLIHDFGEFKGRWWSADSITIQQRPINSQWPSVAFFGAQSKATLGSRCNIMIVDDPVTADNSSSELERERLRSWYEQAAATCPYPLPLKMERYLRKLFLIGTTFHMDDLYHTCLRSGMYKHLWLKAVDLKTGETLSPRFTYRSREELKVSAETNEQDALLLENVEKGKIISLADYRKSHSTRAFMRRYQNEVRDDSTSTFPELWFRGGEDDWAPPGGYPGCLEDNEHYVGRSLGEKPDVKQLTVLTGVDPAAGTKGSYTVRFACVTLGCDIQNDPNTVYLIDLDFGQQPMVSDNPAKTSQVDIVLDHVKKYGGRVVLETNNVQGVWAQELRKEANARKMMISISGHNTSKGKKVDEKQGIEAMTAMIENGYLRLPYKLPSDRKKVDELIEEFTYWGSYATDDILMAFWFAWRTLDRMKRSRRTKPVERQAKPAYYMVGERWNFPPHWTQERINAFLSGAMATEEEEDEYE